jgi:hypothetical protein
MVMTNTNQVRLAGTAYIIGSVLWLAVLGAQTAIWGFEPPARSAAFYAFEAALVVTQALLLYGFFGVLWSGGIGQGLFGKLAFGLGVLGHLIFVAGEILSLAAGTVSDLIALGALVSALGLVLTGLAVLMAKRWAGWTRWAPLLAGLFPFLLMFPFLFISDEPNGYAVAGWGLARLALGLAIRAQESVSPAAAASRGTSLPPAKV